ncbi:MAG: M36 family metallopeptidase [Saprospiraceae bacterium]|nr:M36 family metallopeptidase [Saprospiraceae bacterium]
MSGALNANLVTIPSIFMKKSECDKIRLVINNGDNVNMTFQSRERVGAEYLDGALDNGIIAHEFAHGVSSRLIGGRKNSSCLFNDEQMGEGWSDFFALIMTHEVGDKGTDARGMGTFAFAQLPTGSGIRRYPYSTDMNINPQTFDDIKGTTIPHSLGEVWADVLWDMYWAFIDKYGYNPDWKIETSGNHRAAFLVMEGMKIQPCSPGFIQGRDAILMADKLHFASENKCLIWSVFARRGLGINAVGGLTSSRNDGVENFEFPPTCIEKLKISKTATVSVNAGDQIDVELKTINHIPSRQANVVITDELPDGLTYVAGSGSINPVVSGNLLTFNIGDMDYEKAINITYKAKTSVNNKSLRTAFDDFENFTWDIGKNEGNEDWGFNSDLFRSPENSLNIINVSADVDAFLISTPYLVSGANPAMRFWHQYNTQAGNDGGFVEVSVDGGAFDIIKKDKFIRNPYNSLLDYETLAIPGLEGFAGKSSGTSWVESYIDLSEYKGKTCSFRFRFASNATVAATGDFTGWFIDDFELLDIYKYVAQACISADQGLGEKACTDGIETFINSDGTVSADDVNKDYFSINITPNPARDFILVAASSPNKVSTLVSVLSSEGKSVYDGKMIVEAQGNTMTINTSGFLPGLYILKIQSGKNMSVKKFIIK